MYRKSSFRPFCRISKAASIVRRFLCDDLGAELVQFALVLPILVALLWGSFEVWQIMGLRSAVRSTVAQAARFVTAYGAPPEEMENPPPPADICWGIDQLIASSLSQHRGNLGDALSWSTTWYRIRDPTSSFWEINGERNYDEVDCLDLLSGFMCGGQFGVELRVTVPWQTVIFGLEGSSTTNFVLEMSDMAMGTAPCEPYCSMAAGGGVVGHGGPGGCVVEISWGFKCSYEPDRCEIFVDGHLVEERFNPVYVNWYRTTVPVGRTTIRVDCYGGRRKCSDAVTVRCP